MRAIKVIGNNEGLYTERAYEELRLQMSTGDFHTHKTETVSVDSYDEVIGITDLIPTACFVCERTDVQGKLCDEFTAPICDTCKEEHDLHCESHEYMGNVKRLRDQFVDALTFKQYNELEVGHYLPSNGYKVTKSAKLHKLLDRIADQLAIVMAYDDAKKNLKN